MLIRRHYKVIGQFSETINWKIFLTDADRDLIKEVQTFPDADVFFQRRKFEFFLLIALFYTQVFFSVHVAMQQLRARKPK